MGREVKREPTARKRCSLRRGLDSGE
jgi:hypothetical protein